MPFCKVPAPPSIHTRDVTSDAWKSSTKTAATNSSEAIANWNAGARRVRAPLRHSVDGAPTPAMTSGSSSRLVARHHFRSSYADPAVANGADPYVKITSYGFTGNGFTNRTKSSASLMTLALRPEAVQKADMVTL